MCDYHTLNHITVPDRYPIPHLYDFCTCHHFLQAGSGAGISLIPADPSDIHKTAVTTQFDKLFEFLKIPFGLCSTA